MRTKDFIARAISKRNVCIHDKPYGFEAADYRRVTELTAHFKFPCDFKDGACYRYREFRQKDEFESRERYNKCCCNACGRNIGYLEYLPNYMWDIRIIAGCYNEDDGFWRLETGCILPRRYRSLTCVSYSCDLYNYQSLKRVEDVANPKKFQDLIHSIYRRRGDSSWKEKEIAETSFGVANVAKELCLRWDYQKQVWKRRKS